MASIILNGRLYGGSPTVADADHIACDNGSGNEITLQQMIENILGNFATIESSTTASKAYKVGQYFILNSYLYRVTTAIAAGGTIDISSSGNAVKTDVGTEESNRVLDFVNVVISAGTGDIATINDARITGAHKVAGYNVVWGDSSKITSNVTITTSEGQAVINGTASAATTATFQLVKPS